MEYTRRKFLGNMGKALVGIALASAFPDIVQAEENRIYLPKVGRVNLNQPIIPGGNFYWGEATKYGQRIPKDAQIVNNIVESAEYMQKIRSYFENKRININSWYRDQVTNKEMGGSSRSRHLFGDAVDFCVEGVSPEEVYRMLDSYHGKRGGLGRYMQNGFTHIDLRGKRARWKIN